MGKNKLKKLGVISLVAMMSFSMLPNTSMTLSAKDGEARANVDAAGYNVLGAVSSVDTSKNKVTFNISTGERVRFTFLEENVFRMYMAPAGEDFKDYPTPNSSTHTATITNKSDSDYEVEYDVNVSVTEDDEKYYITTKKVTIEVKKAETLVKVKKDNGEVVFEETAPLKYKEGSTIQTLSTDEDEYFYGGGTQNGRFSHKGEIIEIVNTNNWVDRGVASPNPFYWSTDGYGVVRNTWKPGAYDFGKEEKNTVTTKHNERRFDAYYFVDDTAETVLNDYYELTGSPAELPEYASYLGHLNCYNRDYWVETSEGQGVKLGDKWYKESQSDNGGVKESLLGEGDMTAQQIIEDHKNNDMPLGWFLPNDGYGCGYGQTDSQAGDIAYLGDFADYAIQNGVETGLWTQSNLWPADPANPQKGERDIFKEVEAGVHSVKTDVAWVGPGYSMALNGISVAYDAISSASGLKPNIVTLDGWAGTQRYGGIWTGDQYGGQWEYIRFHIPTYIGTGLSGQPNVGSDMDGIFGGKNPKVWTRDFQWKAFTTYMLDMDGWGSNQKSPWALGENGTSINRAYLKLKAKLMPYINTISHEATAQGGLPMLRAMFLEEENAYTLGTATQYQYMWGDNFLVAPIYQETAADAEGNDIRNDIYLPGTSDIWVDYFTGKQYRGGQILNNFDAPIWKLPVFVKNGSIIPQYAENNNPEAKSETNVDGLDRSQRIVEFFPSGKTNFTAYEDDGKTLGGASTKTNLTSNVEKDVATLTAEKAIGNYVGMVKERSNEFIVNVQKAPTKVEGTVKGSNVTFKEVDSKEAYEKAEGNVYFYDATPSIFVKEFASEGSKYASTEDTTAPKLYVKSTEKVDITAYDYKVVISGFDNTEDLGVDELNESMAVPTNVVETEKTSKDITISWEETQEAVTYDVEADGIVYRNINVPSFKQTGLTYLTDHTYRVRAVSKAGYSHWTEPVTLKTADDPYRNVAKDLTISFVGGTVPKAYGGKFEYVVDGDNKSEYSSADSGAWKDQEFIIDQKRSFTMDKFEYICRENMGNGAVTTFGLKYSNDGINWTEYGDFTHKKDEGIIHPDNEDGRTFVHKFKEPFKARYLKFKVKVSAGGFFQAYEVRPYHVDKDLGTIIGDTNNSGGIEDNDLTFYENYIGLKPGDGDWNYAAGLGDIDNNGVVDAFDLAYVATKLGEPITTPAKGVEGRITLIPSKTFIKAGDEVTIDIYGVGLKNVNAFSIELPVDSELFEVSNFGSPALSSMFMRNFSKTRIHSELSALGTENFVCFTNIGNQELINGNGSIASMRIKATSDFKWDTLETAAVLVGQDLSTVDARIDATQKPTAPETKNTLTEADVKSVQFNNEHGTNINPDVLWQGADWKKALLDNDKATVAEFKWYFTEKDIAKEVMLPTDMVFEFNKVQPLKTVTVYNRTSSNGRVTSAKAKAYKGDTEYDLGTISTAQDEYVFTVPTTAVNGIDKVVITPLTSLGAATGTQTGSEANRMLTLRGVEFVTDSKVSATSVAFDKNNPTSVNVGGVEGVSAIVSPNNASNPFYNVTSSNEEVAKVVKVPTATNYLYVVQGVSAGKVTLTATSEDGAHTDTMEFEVYEGANKTSLVKQIQAFEALYENLFTPESYATLAATVAEARVLIAKDDVAQDQIDTLTVKIAQLIREIEYKGSNEDQPSSVNLIAQSEMARFDESSYAKAEGQDASNVIDGKADTIWHSNYSAGYKLPQYVTIDLGKEYNLEQIDMLARQAGSNGHITRYRVEVSTDEGENKVFKPVVEGTFQHDGTALKDPGTAKEIKFDATPARFVRFIALESLGGTKNAYASIAELNFYGLRALDDLTTLLDKAYDIVDNVNDGKISYTPSTYDPFYAAFEAAADLEFDTEATPEQNYTARLNLTLAMSNLVEEASIDDLDNLIAMINNLNEIKEKYSEETFAKAQELIDATTAMFDQEEITHQEAVTMYKALVNEYATLSKIDDKLAQAKEALSYAIRSGEAALSNDVSTIRPGKVKALEDAIAAGKELLTTEGTHSTVYFAATDTILNAINELWVIVDNAKLVDLIKFAQAIVGNYTEATKAEFDKALAEAIDVAADKDATTDEVENAIKRLNTAITNLKVELANKEALQHQINFAQRILDNAASYVTSSIRGLGALVTSANELMKNTEATQADVDKMVQRLISESAKARLKADKTALVAAVAMANDINYAEYSTASVVALRNAVYNANRVLNDEGATQGEIDAVIKGIERAKANLVKKAEPKPGTPPPGTPAPGNPDRPNVTPVVPNRPERPARPNVIPRVRPAQGNETNNPTVEAKPAEKVEKKETPKNEGVSEKETPLASVTSNDGWQTPAMVVLGGSLLLGLALLIKKRKAEKK